MTTRLVLVFVLCLSGVFAIVTDDEYMTEVQKRCETNSDFANCGKYEILKYISKAATGAPTTTISGTMELVNIEQTETAILFPAARQRSEDSEVRKIVKFLQRQMDAFLGSRAIAISLPEQIRLVDPSEPTNEIVSGLQSNLTEARGKKKRVSMLIPIIMLFKLFKVKVLLTAVLVGVLFIKKALIILFLIAPSYLHMLKICKQPHYSHPHVEEHEFAGTGYGYGHQSHATHGAHAAFAKDWSGNSRAYSAYRPS